MYDILCFKSQHTGTTGLEHALICPGCSPSVTPTFHLDGFAEKKKNFSNCTVKQTVKECF